MLGAIIGAGASLASSLLGKSSADSANKAAQANAARQEQLQKDFAQQGIRWKVADAKAAGIHPLYALGANTVSYSPVSVGQTSTDFSGLAKAGQDIGRAIDQTRSPGERQGALQTTFAAVQLEGAKLDNDIKRAELASKLATNATRGPAMPPTAPSHWDGQGEAIKLDGNNIKLETKRDVSDPNQPAYVAGTGPGTMFYKNATGGYSPIMPPELAESFESDWMGGLDWQIRNRFVPSFNPDGVYRPAIPVAPGYKLEWDGLRQEWLPVAKSRRRPTGMWSN